MNKKKKALWCLLLSVFCVIGLFFLRIPPTLPIGEDPVLVLPLYNFSTNNAIQGYGQISADHYHNGIDFGVNASTEIVSPHDAFIEDIKFQYNDEGGHWQTNVRLWLNFRWEIEIVFESWALNESYGILQKDAILFTVGEFVAANQTLGILLYHGLSAHIHFGISSSNSEVCPYTYFSPSAKATFEAQFWLVNYTPHWCM